MNTVVRRFRVPIVVAVVTVVAAILVGVLTRDLDIRFTTRPVAIVVTLGVVVLVVTVAARVVAARNRRRTETIRREADERIRAGHRQFVARLDHELKNPITAMRLGLLNLPGDTGQGGLVGDLGGQLDRIQSLVTELRKISELEQLPVSPEPVDLAAVLHDVFDACANLGLGPRRFAALLPEAPRRLPPLLVDPDLLRLALFNLVSNAVKYSVEGARIEVRASEHRNRARIEVSDTGRGIPPELLDIAWDELVRGRDVGPVGGHGLGLAMVRAIVRRLDGSCSLSSIPGRGTTVHLELPLAVRSGGVSA